MGLHSRVSVCGFAAVISDRSRHGEMRLREWLRENFSTEGNETFIAVYISILVVAVVLIFVFGV